MQAVGNELRLVYSVAAGYEAWANAKSLLEGSDGFEQDADGDGIANGLEFVLGTEPGEASQEGLPAIVAEGNDVVFTFNRADEAIYLAPVVQYSGSLEGVWTTAIHGENGVTISIEPAGEDAETVAVTIPKGSSETLFVRLAVLAEEP